MLVCFNLSSLVLILATLTDSLSLSFSLHMILVMLSFMFLIPVISNLTIPAYINCLALVMLCQLLEEFHSEHVNHHLECKIMSPTMWSILFPSSCLIIDSLQHIVHSYFYIRCSWTEDLPISIIAGSMAACHEWRTDSSCWKPHVEYSTTTCWKTSYRLSLDI